jgi:hypothetical protein
MMPVPDFEGPAFFAFYGMCDCRMAFIFNFRLNWSGFQLNWLQLRLNWLQLRLNWLQFRLN